VATIGQVGMLKRAEVLHLFVSFALAKFYHVLDRPVLFSNFTWQIRYSPQFPHGPVDLTIDFSQSFLALHSSQ